MHYPRLSYFLSLGMVCFSLLLQPAYATGDHDNNDHHGHDSSKKITVQNVDDLSFGTLASGQSGGTVTIDAQTGSRSVQGNLTDVQSDAQRALFRVEGKKNKKFRINVPTSIPLSPNSSGRSGDAAATLRTYPEYVGQLDQNGYALVFVGGELQINGAASASTYRGQFDLQVEYLNSGDDD